MKLAISNIGWAEEQDSAVYGLMKQYGFTGLEIAPTRIFPEKPYERLKEAKDWAEWMKRGMGFEVPSMQSIWFGRQERLFGSAEERYALKDYTRRAVDFARAVGCRNLVFGCPRNRALPEEGDPKTGIAFFKEMGDYAAGAGTAIGMEANPPIYHTNYINDTVSALQLIREVGSKGFKLNLDVGTMIQNEESAEELRGMGAFINHVHISEPGLKTIEKRKLHQQLKAILEEEEYQGFISVEMGKREDLREIEDTLEYVKEIFS